VKWAAYPQYKASGIEWLGDIPSSWSVAEIKQTHHVTLGKMLTTEATSPEDVLLPYLRAAHIPPTGFTLDDPKEMWFTPKEKAGLTLKMGDVVVVEGGMGGYGRCDIVPEDLPGWGFQNSINRLRPKNGGSGAYTKYLLQIAREKGFIDVLCSVSTMPHLTAEKLGAIRLPRPHAAEQWAIAGFLDHETAKIDALIAKQEQLIATLREDRTATITQAVTKGLDLDAGMKDSGVPWIGQVPRHWTLGKVKHGFSVVLGKMYQGERQSPDDELLPHLKAGSLTETLDLDLDDPMLCWFTPDERKKLSVRKDDLLVVEGGATYGRCALVKEDLPGWGFQKSLNRVRTRNGASIHFLAYLIQTATHIGHVSILCGKATIPHFTAEKLESLEWPHPSVTEQRLIVDFLDRRCAKIDTLIAKANEVIDTLREYRSALITDAVTGKIDVRGAA
jgi:type I restriction enzyme S subunit